MIIPTTPGSSGGGGLLRRGSFRRGGASRRVTAAEHSAPTKSALMYAGTVPCHHDPEQAKQMLAQSQLPLREVSVRLTSDHMVVSDAVAREDILTRALVDIYGYRLEPDSNLFFFGAREPVSGLNFCHVFQATGHAASDVFSAVHKRMQQVAADSIKASDLARQNAITQLLDGTAPAPDGAFLLRESTSQGENYALTLKHDGTFTHFLIRKDITDGAILFSFKDANVTFPSLGALIQHHCEQSDGLPCCLTLKGSHWHVEGTDMPAEGGDWTAPPLAVPPTQPTPPPPAISCPWFADMSRPQAETFLRDCGMQDGSFCVRASSVEGQYALSFAHNGGAVHMLLKETERGIFVDDVYCAPTIMEVRRNPHLVAAITSRR